jgi:hypothetical protein
MTLNKIPLEPLIDILTDIFNNGADYVDLSGTKGENGEDLRDILKISIKSEYIVEPEEDEDDDEDHNIEVDYEEEQYNQESTRLSDDDIDDLI